MSLGSLVSPLDYQMNEMRDNYLEDTHDDDAQNVTTAIIHKMITIRIIISRDVIEGGIFPFFRQSDELLKLGFTALEQNVFL